MRREVGRLGRRQCPVGVKPGLRVFPLHVRLAADSVARLDAFANGARP